MSTINATESNGSDEITGEITRKATPVNARDDLIDPNDYEFMTVEWKIPDFFRLSKKVGRCLKSPTFSFLDGVWRLEICPNRKKFYKRWVTIHLRKVHSTTKSRYVFLKARMLDQCDSEWSGMSCGSTYEGNDSVYGGPIMKRWELLEEFVPQIDDIITIVGELQSKICKNEEVVSQAMCTEGGDKCIEGKGKESENTDGVTEDVTLPKRTGVEKCIEGKRKESENINGLTEDATLPEPTGGDKCIEGKRKESENTDGVTEDVTLPKPTGIDKLASDFKNLLNSEKDCDVTLKLKNKELRAHKIILRSRSSVFDSMFDHDMSEKNSGVVDIPDCDPEAFQYFLTYLYSASVDNLSNDIVINLYFIADKYDTVELKHKCVDFMASNLSVNSFCNVVALSLQHEESALLQTATDFFMKNTIAVIESVQWQSFLRENPVTANEFYKKSFHHNINQK